MRSITATVTSFLIVGEEPVKFADQLERLATLHADGRVIDEEYRAAKATVIG
jgi:hypothetical protein